uniref:Uncharacterized protein n=1 Tax=Anguilla anguilla TaxID=7936 RepID=A0A0E9QE32_ANGAN
MARPFGSHVICTWSPALLRLKDQLTLGCPLCLPSSSFNSPPPSISRVIVRFIAAQIDFFPVSV